MSVEQIKQLAQAVVHLAMPLAESMTLDLVDVVLKGRVGDIRIEVAVDKPEGGIGIDACAAFNRALVEAIDKEHIFNDDGYSLEVSSPGLDRPLITQKDFVRNKHQQVRVFLKEAVAGKKEHVGVVIDVGPEFISLQPKRGEVISVSLSLIIKGMLVI